MADGPRTRGSLFFACGVSSELMDKIPMTRVGNERLMDELRRLKSEERPAVVRAIEEARGYGDLS